MTLINVNTVVERPLSVPAERHLFLGMSDIVAPMEGHILPGETQVHQLLSFAKKWDRQAPLLIHCWAGISRSTASALISACALRPDIDERVFTQAVRAASRTATPNRLMIAIADQMLGRQGRLISAVEAIGQGELSTEGIPFSLNLA